MKPSRPPTSAAVIREPTAWVIAPGLPRRSVIESMIGVRRAGEPVGSPPGSSAGRPTTSTGAVPLRPASRPVKARTCAVREVRTLPELGHGGGHPAGAHHGAGAGQPRAECDRELPVDHLRRHGPSLRWPSSGAVRDQRAAWAQDRVSEPTAGACEAVTGRDETTGDAPGALDCEGLDQLDSTAAGFSIDRWRAGQPGRRGRRGRRACRRAGMWLLTNANTSGWPSGVGDEAGQPAGAA